MIILASASPRRTEILSTLGVEHIIFTANADESSDITDPHLLTKELAERKGLAVYEELKKNSPEGIDAERAVIISADTVVYANRKILGKPRDAKNAEEMLRSLSGKTHEVISGIAITLGGVTKSASVSTKVRVDDVPEGELIAYANSDKPLDKAGAYKIQGHFSPWISGIEGCYFNVVGLPVNSLSHLFKKATGERI
jgi:septum formation protein